MELFQLRQFLTIAQVGSMGKASQLLYLPRATLSQNLKNLERELGCELFERRSNRLVITECGQILEEYATKAIAILDEAESKIELVKRKRQSIIRIGVFSKPMAFHRMPHLAHSFPEIQFEVLIGPEDELKSGLMRDELDFIIVTEAAGRLAGTVTIPLEKEQACLSVPPRSKYYDAESVNIADLEGITLFLAADLQGTSQWYEALASRSKVGKEDIIVAPAEEYLSEMSRSNYCHFSTTRLVNFFGLGNNRRAVALEGEGTEQLIVAICSLASQDRLMPVINYLKSKEAEQYDNYDIFPYLLMPGQVSNLQME